MEIADVVKSRGNCLRRQVAAVIVKNHRIISTGYNGTPSGVRNCFEGGCSRCANPDLPSGASLEQCVCAHAEENAITQAAFHGVALEGSTLYCSISPCLACARMIISAGIKNVIYGQEYCFTKQAARLLHEAGVTCRQFTPAG